MERAPYLLVLLFIILSKIDLLRLYSFQWIPGLTCSDQNFVCAPTLLVTFYVLEGHTSLAFSHCIQISPKQIVLVSEEVIFQLMTFRCLLYVLEESRLDQVLTMLANFRLKIE